MKKKQDERLVPAKDIKIVVNLCFSFGWSDRGIAKATKLSGNTVGKIRNRIFELGLTSPKDLNDLAPAKIQEMFYPKVSSPQMRLSSVSKLMPDFKQVASELIETKQEQKTMYNLYIEKAKAQGREPISLTYFCGRLKQELDLIKEQEPEYYFAQQFPFAMYCQLDFSGSIYKVATFNGEQKCWLMVICFPASYYVYAEFVTAQSTAESCRVMGNLVRTLGKKAPAIAVVDNAKCFVIKHSGSEAIINPSFESYLQDLGMCVEAAPVRHPQAKSSVEYSVNLVQKMMLGYQSTFANTTRTLTEHNRILKEKIDEVINRGPFRKSNDKTREYLFQHYELPLLASVDKIPPYLGEATTLIVPRSYLITVNGHKYSVPHLYIKSQVDVYVTNDLVIIKHEGQEIARHQRSDGDGKTVNFEHMPEEHQEIENRKKMYRTPEDVLNACEKLDEGVYRFCKNRLAYDLDNKRSIANSIRCCVAVMNFYKCTPHKDFFSEACISVLTTFAPYNWTSYKVKEMQEQIIREYLCSNKVEHQTELFRPSSLDDAYLREQDE